MKMSLLISFALGAAAMFGFTTLASPPSHHVYELRLYHPLQGKRDALSARFRDHTDALFKRHNMKAIGYWMPEDTNLFVYILEHPSREEAKKNWDAFHEDAEWKRVKAASEANGSLVDHIDSYFMDPTGYSPMQ